MVIKKVILVGLFIIPFSSVLADSPITSTAFYISYYEIPQIINAEKEGIMTYEFSSYLSSTTVSIDKKIALVNALGWDFAGKKNKKLYETFLRAKYKTSGINYKMITPDENLCLGYLAIMDDYNHVREPLKIIKDALKRNPKSYTYNIVYGLVLSQMMFSLDGVNSDSEQTLVDLIDYNLFDSSSSDGWCNVYQILAKIEANRTLKQDFRVSAKRNIFSYVKEYKASCAPEDLILIPSTSYLNDLTDTRIKLALKQGVYKMPVNINEALTIDFIFDSGASDVLISNDIFTTLIKQNKIDKGDIIGYEYYKIADGSTVKQLSFIIRKLQIGQIVVTNIKASVGGSSSPLLLGQSFMQKFKQFTIDNENGYLLIEPKYARIN